MSTDATSLNPQTVYRYRFTGMEEYRNKLWALLCGDFFQKFIPQNATVIELAAGHCEFINNIRAQRRIAIDINKDTALHAGAGVEALIAEAWAVGAVADGSADIIFISNFLEHLPKDKIVSTLREGYRLLKPGGQVLILQPNFRYTYRDYWMFFDHVTPIDDRALCEVLLNCGFTVRQCIDRFLPYTMQSRLFKGLGLVRLYLKIPLIWKLFGGQCFVRAERPGP